MSDLVILVNENDEQTGVMPKLEVHEKGLLHRAISVFIFNSNMEMLLQRRSQQKYHSPGLWSNTCCSHPAPGELAIDAAQRRLMQEMGLKTKLSHLFSFTYKVDFENGLTEHEFDHVFVGITDDIPASDPVEVMDHRYVNSHELLKSVRDESHLYTEWFKICVKKVLSAL